MNLLVFFGFFMRLKPNEVLIKNLNLTKLDFIRIFSNPPPYHPGGIRSHDPEHQSLRWQSETITLGYFIRRFWPKQIYKIDSSSFSSGTTELASGLEDDGSKASATSGSGYLSKVVNNVANDDKSSSATASARKDSASHSKIVNNVSNQSSSATASARMEASSHSRNRFCPFFFRR
jgi:hypothetical protein